MADQPGSHGGMMVVCSGHKCEEADRSLSRQRIIPMCTAASYSPRQSLEG